MKTVTKAIISISIIAVWVISMCIFVPYDLEAVSADNSLPNKFFTPGINYIVDDAFDERFENGEEILHSLSSAVYTCISDDEIYDILVNKGNNPVNGYVITDTLMGLFSYLGDRKVASVAFFEMDGKSYVLFILDDESKAPLRVLSYCYTIFEVDGFDASLSEHFVTSQRIISKPAGNATIEAFIQSGIVTLIFGAIVFVVYIIISTKRYKASKKSKKLSDDAFTTDSDIKKYIMNKLGSEFFDAERIYDCPCITADAKDEKAVEFITALCEHYGVKEIFAGSFFEEKCYLDAECDRSIYIKEYLDEKSYCSLNHIKNKIVLEWITDGNNAEETSISFYIQELNALIYPMKNKLYIFSKDSRTLYDKLITVINPTDYNMSF